MTTLVFCTADELDATGERVAEMRAAGADAYLRDAAALVYAAEGSGLQRADAVLATPAALVTVRLHYPDALRMPLDDSRGGEPGPAGSGASASAKDGPVGAAEDAPVRVARKRGRGRAE